MACGAIWGFGTVGLETLVVVVELGFVQMVGMADIVHFAVSVVVV